MSEQKAYDPTTIVPTSIADALARWDAGLPVFTIEMGGTGLGPGYEQCIQVAVVYALRRYTMMPERRPTMDASALARRFIDEASGELGLTGMQCSAAMSLATSYIRDGWRATLASAPKERHTQVSSAWPREPAVPEAVT